MYIHILFDVAGVGVARGILAHLVQPSGLLFANI